jgi:hypothetical protein
MLGDVADETPASRGLLRALRSGRKAASVPEWQHRPSNVKAATEHFLNVAVRETATIESLDSNGRLEYAHDWLKKANQLADQLYRIGGFHPRTELKHQSSWLQSFEGFLKAISN